MVCLASSSSSSSGDRKISPVIETMSDMDNNELVAGGVRDVYGEDKATEDHFVTPWSYSVAR